MSPTTNHQPEFLTVGRQTNQTPPHVGKRSAKVTPYFDVAVQLFGDKGNIDWKEVVGVTTDGQFHRTRLIGRVYHRQPPFQNVLAVVVAILALALINHGRPDAGSESKQKNALEFLFVTS